VVILELVFPTPIVTFNMVDFPPFTFEAFFLNGRRNSTTLDSLLYAFNYCRNVSELLCWTTHHMFVAQRLKQLDLSISKHISICFLCPICLDWTSWLCQEQYPYCACIASQMHSPNLSIYRSWCCLILCTSPMLPPLSYLKKMHQ